jgi:quinolinate synthase
VHETFSLQKLMSIKQQHPDAKIIAHPECEEPLLERADFIGSTAALLKYVENDNAESFIVVTEPGIIHQMQKRAPKKNLIPAPPDGNCACNECPFMRLNTPEKVYLALRDLEPRLEMDEELRRKALIPIERMLALS